jgi:hypothetical protein
VTRDLAIEERHRSGSTLLAEIARREAGSGAGMHRKAILQIRQREVGLAVPAVGRPEQREERGVL